MKIGIIWFYEVVKSKHPSGLREIRKNKEQIYLFIVGFK